MTTTATETPTEAEVFRHRAGMIDQTVRVNLDGLTHEDSLVQPRPAGNCLNWVLGHLLNAYHGALALLGQEPVLEEAVLERYARGGTPLTDPSEAVDFDELLAAWEETTKRIDAGLAELDPEILDQPAPFSPTGDPDETVRSLLSAILFHQAYHAGQTAILRRLAGKEGAIS